MNKDSVFKPGEVRKHNRGNLNIFHKAALDLEYKRQVTELKKNYQEQKKFTCYLLMFLN